MKALFIVLITFIAVGSYAQKKDPFLLSPNDFDNKLKEKAGIAQLVDVRTAEEFGRGHLRRAMNLNFNDDNFEDLVKAKLDKNLPVFLYCFSGRRSSDATVFLKDLGFKEVYDLEGGFAKWTSSSKPYVSSSTNTQPIAAFTLENLDQIVKTNDIVLIDFYTEWCGPCKKMTPILNKIANENKHIKLLKLDAEKNDNISSVFQVDEIPTYVIIKKGTQVWRGIGEMNEAEMREVIQRVK